MAHPVVEVNDARQTLDSSSLPIPNLAHHEGSGLEVYHGVHNSPVSEQHRGALQHARHEINGPLEVNNNLGTFDIDREEVGRSNSSNHGGSISTHSESVKTAADVTHPRWSHLRRDRVILGMGLSTFLQSCILFLLTVAVCLLAGLLSTRITALEQAAAARQASLEASSSLPASPPPPTTTTTTTGLRSQPPATTELSIPGWTFQGCYFDHGINRALRGDHNWNPKDNFPNAINGGLMSNRVCASHCLSVPDANYTFFGTENSVLCYCDTVFNPPAVADVFGGRAPDWKCNVQCNGVIETSEACGGFSALSVWRRDLEGEGEGV